MKILDNRLFNAIEEEAKASPRRRMSHDLRTQAMDEEPDWRDSSQLYAERHDDGYSDSDSPTYGIIRDTHRIAREWGRGDLFF